MSQKILILQLKKYYKAYGLVQWTAHSPWNYIVDSSGRGIMENKFKGLTFMESYKSHYHCTVLNKSTYMYLYNICLDVYLK